MPFFSKTPAAARCCLDKSQESSSAHTEARDGSSASFFSQSVCSFYSQFGPAAPDDRFVKGHPAVIRILPVTSAVFKQTHRKLPGRPCLHGKQFEKQTVCKRLRKFPDLSLIQLIQKLPALSRLYPAHNFFLFFRLMFHIHSPPVFYSYCKEFTENVVIYPGQTPPRSLHTAFLSILLNYCVNQVIES